METLITTSSTLLQRKRIFVVIYQFVLKTRFEKCLLISIATTLHFNTNFEKCKKLNFFWEKNTIDWLTSQQIGERDNCIFWHFQKRHSPFDIVCLSVTMFMYFCLYMRIDLGQEVHYLYNKVIVFKCCIFSRKNILFSIKKLMGNLYVTDVT